MGSFCSGKTNQAVHSIVKKELVNVNFRAIEANSGLTLRPLTLKDKERVRRNYGIVTDTKMTKFKLNKSKGKKLPKTKKEFKKRIMLVFDDFLKCSKDDYSKEKHEAFAGENEFGN